MAEQLGASQKSTRKANSRAKFSCPDELKEMLELVNLAPTSKTVPYWRDVLAWQTAEYVFKYGVEFYKNPVLLRSCFEDAINISTRDFDAEAISELQKREELYHWIRFDFPPGMHELTGTSWYPSFSVIYHNLMQLAFHYDRVREANFEKPPHLDPTMWKPDLDAPIIINSNSRIKVAFAGFANLVNGVNGDRIRICARARCRKLFWAKRVEAVTCSESCANANRQFRFRNLSADEKERRCMLRQEKRKEKIIRDVNKDCNHRKHGGKNGNL
jgi:hypothetical protein